MGSRELCACGSRDVQTPGEVRVEVTGNFYFTQDSMLVCTLTTTVKNLGTSDNAAAAVAKKVSCASTQDSSAGGRR